MTSSSTRPPASAKEPKELKVEKVMTFSTAGAGESTGKGKRAISTLEREEIREQLLNCKMESGKTLKHLTEIKVDVSVYCVF